MTTTETIALADKLIDPIVGDGTQHYEKIAPGRYLLSEVTAEDPQEVTAVHVVAGLAVWATETANDAGAEQLEVETARAVLEERFDDVIDLLRHPGNLAGVYIWDQMSLMAAESSDR